MSCELNAALIVTGPPGTFAGSPQHRSADEVSIKLELSYNLLQAPFLQSQHSLVIATFVLRGWCGTGSVVVWCR